MNRLKRLLPGTSQLMHNFLSLSAIQAFNYLVPILTFPYMLRVIGLERFGAYQYAMVIIGYLGIIIDYGYNMSATPLAAQNRHEPEALQRLFNEVFSGRLLLMGATAILLPLTYFFWQPIDGFAEVLLVLFPGLVASIFIPTWLYQGVEKMGYAVTLHFSSRLIQILGLVLAVRKPEDWVTMAWLNTGGQLAASGISLYILKRNFGLMPHWAGWNASFKSLKSGAALFFSQFAISCYLMGGLFLVGFTRTTRENGIYALADKVLQLIRQLLILFFQTVFPRASLLIAEQPQAAGAFFRKFLLILFLVFGTGGVILFLQADWIVQILAGKPIPEVLPLLRIMAFIPLVVAINIPAFQALLILGEKRAYATVLISGAMLNLVLTILALRFSGLEAVAWALLITEIWITTGLHGALWKKAPSFSVWKGLF